jgi:membrane-bound inhibitor of C-type lysozyme
MNTRTLWIALIVVVVIALGAWAYLSAPAAQGPAAAARTLSSTVVYACDGGKSITAAYYEGPAAPAPAPGEPPAPSGSVDVSIGGAATTTLAQTISADGTRYSDGDPQLAQGTPGAESLVFWSKGDSALIMRGNQMDLDYTNCTAAPAGA